MHLDSMRLFNIRVARQVAEVSGKHLPAIVDMPVENPKTPKQRNSNDCGLYVIGVVEVICNWWFSRTVDVLSNSDWESLVRKKLANPDKVGKMREKCAQIVAAYVNKVK